MMVLDEARVGARGLAAALLGAAMAGGAHGANFAYDVSGEMVYASQWAGMLRDLAGLDTLNGHVVFDARILIDGTVEPQVVNNTPTVRSWRYDGAIESVRVDLGASDHRTQRALHDVPGSTASMDHESLIITNDFVSPTMSDRLDLEVLDTSTQRFSPVRLFDSDAVDIDFTIGGFRYDRLEYRITAVDLLLSGPDMLDGPAVPTGADGFRKATIDSFGLRVEMAFIGPGAPTQIRTGDFAADFDLSVSAVPEPGAPALMLAGLAVLGLRVAGHRRGQEPRQAPVR